MEAFSIRKCEAEDLDAIVAIERQSFTDPWPKRLFAHMLRSGNTHFFVGELKGMVVGYIIGRRDASDLWSRAQEPKVFGHVMNIAVTPSYRQKGLGMKLMLALEQAFKKEGLYCVKLEVRASNVEAQRFYAHLGYAAEGRIPLYYHDEDGIIMRKDLHISH